MSLAESILAGNLRAAARLITLIDDGDPAAVPELKRLYPATGKAAILGITGPPGAGKSTLTDQLIGKFRQRGLGVAVVAIDPTSHLSGGAILGDRVRMSRHAADPGVFIRSLGTRGHLGGISRSTHDIVNVFDAMGKEVVIIETVGVGQDEIEITRAAHTSLVVTVPGLGDEVQAIKAGVMEIADIFVVNKADRPGSEKTIGELQALVGLNHPGPRRVVAAGSGDGGQLQPGDRRTGGEDLRPSRAPGGLGARPALRGEPQPPPAGRPAAGLLPEPGAGAAAQRPDLQRPDRGDRRPPDRPLLGAGAARRPPRGGDAMSGRPLPDLTGVLLAGGRSRRMGRDKAQLEIAGKTLFERSLELLREFCATVLIAGDRPDLARPGLPALPDLYPGSALGGLYTGLAAAQTEWILVAPCDMPFPDRRIVIPPVAAPRRGRRRGAPHARRGTSRSSPSTTRTACR